MVAIRIPTFDVYQAGYGGATVEVRKANLNALASLFKDEAKTIPAPNPIMLAEISVDGANYGKWPHPIYVDEPYEIWTSSIDRSGVVRPPLTDLDGTDASLATVIPGTGTQPNTLKSLLARQVYAADYGVINDTDTAANTLTIQTAIGVAAGSGGGTVTLPPMTIPFAELTIPGAVALCGYGRGVTVLQSQTSGKAVTIAGDRAGLCNLTLDGVNQIADSNGVFGIGKNELSLEHVEIKRFDVGIYMRGGRRAHWSNVSLVNNTHGARLHGDKNADGGNDGDQFSDLAWESGYVADNITTGVELAYHDKVCVRNTLANLTFEANTGDALKIVGAQVSLIDGCAWRTNTKNITIADHTDMLVYDNRVVGFHVRSSTMDSGEITMTGETQDTVYEDVRFTNVKMTMTVPVKHPVLLLDSTESNSTITGDGTKIIRRRSTMDGSASGLTSDATATKAWSLELDPGQVAVVIGYALGKGRNVISTAEYHFEVSAKRPPSQLNFDSQTADFTVGQMVTGQTSKAKGRIVSQTDRGNYGVLNLTDIVGEFIDNEQIKDEGTGVATVNGPLVPQNVTLLGTVLRNRDREDVSGWDATFVANGPEIELRVTGAASTVIEWTVHAQVRST